MTELNRTHLDQLENQSFFIFRDAYHAFKNMAMPWSMGKDSNVLIWLARKSFFGGAVAPYEVPEDPEIVVRTDQQTIDESVTTVLEQLLPRLREYEANE